jgi:hypothetical protein
MCALLAPASNSATATGPISSPTAASNQTPPASDSSDEKKLGVGEIVGIVVGILALIIAVITLVINWQSLKAMIQHKKAETHPENPYERYEHEHEMSASRRW